MQLYNYFNIVAPIAALIYNLLHYREKKALLGGISRSAIQHFKSKKSKGLGKILACTGLWVIIETVFVSVAQFSSVWVMNMPFGTLLNTGANYFGCLYFAPLFMIVFFVILRVDVLKQIDLVVPGYPLALIFVKIACYFGGCCTGIEWEKGLYNPHTGLIEFPAQLLEAAAALMVFVILLICKNKVKEGRLFPVYLMIYSAVRFFTEMLRSEPEVFMGLKTYQILCIAGVAIGMLEYVAVCKYTSWDQRRKTSPTLKNEKRG